MALLSGRDVAQRFFRPESVHDHDFSRAPSLVTRRTNPLQAAYDPEAYSRWDRLQGKLMRWTGDRGVFPEGEVVEGRTRYDEFFAARGPLTGTVLDIGGGWGLFREWWEGDEPDHYVVHDPGTDRFLRGPHAVHRSHYRRAFSRPMTFVEGFGEELPYRNGSFDLCLVASALDHVLDPARVLSEVHRCLRPEGRLLVIQECEGEGEEDHRPTRPLTRKLGRLARMALNPRWLASAVYYRLAYRDPHIHHFGVEDVVGLLTSAAFTDVEIRRVPRSRQWYAFEGVRG